MIKLIAQFETEASYMDLLQHRPNLSDQWNHVLMAWIKQFNGFYFDWNGDDRVLAMQLHGFLSATPQSITDEELMDLIARQFETSFLSASCDKKQWNPINQSYSDFTKNQKGHVFHHVCHDLSPSRRESILNWFKSKLYANTQLN